MLYGSKDKCLDTFNKLLTKIQLFSNNVVFLYGLFEDNKQQHVYCKNNKTFARIKIERICPRTLGLS
ncbi:hypothetical protein HMPREF0645_1319 [Hallella bergensis DSM 17361]|uniref:Uncharacterized protein n=1 Tax=Hallella bergensis DSM 17361 TaxID=585502 RepID=D1PWI4_9BACT|nr:hypothetical protein HMPREF0645_1319 [Hallella bergensis DSM 17361]